MAEDGRNRRIEVDSVNQTTKRDEVRMVNTIDLPYLVGKETKISAPDNSLSRSLWTCFHIDSCAPLAFFSLV